MQMDTLVISEDLAPCVLQYPLNREGLNRGDAVYKSSAVTPREGWGGMA